MPTRVDSASTRQQWIASAGLRHIDQQSEQAFSHIMTSEASSQSSDAALIRQNTRFVSHLSASSPTFANTINSATQAGRNPIEMNYGRTSSGLPGSWDANSGTVTLDPYHPIVGNLGRLHNITALEITNAASNPEFAQIQFDAENGDYERRAVTHTAHPGNEPTSAASLYARDIERVEWQNVKAVCQSMNEAKTAGMPLLPGTDHFRDFFKGLRSWDNFENYIADQKDQGHTRHYEDHYNNRVQPQLFGSQRGGAP